MQDNQNSPSNLGYLQRIRRRFSQLWQPYSQKKIRPTWDLARRPLDEETARRDPLAGVTIRPEDCWRIVQSKTATYACNDNDYVTEE